VILSTFFTMNAFLLYCLSRGEKRRRPAWLYGLSVVFFACGLLSKESAAMLPVLLLSYMFLVEKDTKQFRRTAPYFLITGVYLLARHFLGIAETYPWPSPSGYVLGFLTFLRACLTYLRLIVWPLDLYFDRARAVFVSFADPQLWATVLAITGIVVILARTRKRLTGPVLFFISWFCIELFPVSQIITTIGVQPGMLSAAEHFLYMPVVGVFVLLVLGARKLILFNQKKKLCSAGVCRFVVTGIFLFLMLTTVRQSFDARTAQTMLGRSLDQNPDNARIQYSMGLEMADRERFDEAEQYFRRALAGNPYHMMSRVALGRALHDQGRYVEAITVYETVKDVDGKLDDLLQVNLNEAYQKAIEKYQQWLAKDPGNARLHYSLGTVYSRSKRVTEGIEQYQKAVSLDPDFRDALFNLASSYEAIGEAGWAAAYYERMLAVDAPADDLSRYAQQHLADIYQRQGDAARAEEYFKKADLLELESKK
jgi:tetratricopeptide (TPR) repeat protein